MTRATHRPAERSTRRRLLAGAVRAVAEHHYVHVGVSRILAASDCARTSFYRHFPDAASCIAVAHEEVLHHVGQEATEAWVRASTDGMPRAVEAMLTEVARLARDEPAMARFWLHELPAAGGPLAWQRHQRLLARLTALSRPVIEVSGAPAGRTAGIVAEAFTAGFVADLRARVVSGDDEAIDRLPHETLQLGARFAPQLGETLELLAA